MKHKKLDFFAEIITTNTVDEPEYRGKKGVIIGIREDEKEFYGYSVSLYDYEYGVSFSKDEVIPTGKKFKSEDFY